MSASSGGVILAICWFQRRQASQRWEGVGMIGRVGLRTMFGEIDDLGFSQGIEDLDVDEARPAARR